MKRALMGALIACGLMACQVEDEGGPRPSGGACMIQGEPQKDCETWYDPNTGLIHERCDWYTPCGPCPAVDRDGNGCYRDSVLIRCLSECPG